MKTMLLSILVINVVLSSIAAFAPSIPLSSRTSSSSSQLSYGTQYHNTPVGDDIVLRLPLLEAQLATNKGGPNDMLETSIEDAKMAAEFSVRRAQLRFYEAFAEQNMEKMEEVWSREFPVKCVHPGMPAMLGREAVMQSWYDIFQAATPFTVEPSQPDIEICGRTAICTCVETMNGGGALEAVNVYKREYGEWRLTLHIASPVKASSH